MPGLIHATATMAYTGIAWACGCAARGSPSCPAAHACSTACCHRHALITVGTRLHRSHRSAVCNHGSQLRQLLLTPVHTMNVMYGKVMYGKVMYGKSAMPIAHNVSRRTRLLWKHYRKHTHVNTEQAAGRPVYVWLYGHPWLRFNSISNRSTTPGSNSALQRGRRADKTRATVSIQNNWPPMPSCALNNSNRCGSQSVTRCRLWGVQVV